MIKKGIQTITAIGFKGMNNLFRPRALLVDKQTGMITPAIVFNADVVGGEVIKREGRSRVLALAGAHSLWSDGRIMLCVAAGSVTAQALYQVSGSSATKLADLPDTQSRMSYVAIDDAIYLSNEYWNGQYDFTTQTLRTWGLALPQRPVVNLVDGNLPAGHYRVCYTRYSHGRLSGNGPTDHVFWDTGLKGIQLDNAPADGVVWITHPNGGDFFLATVSGNVITDVYGAQKLPSFGVNPPPYMQNLTYAFGRVWGSVYGKLYYSEPFQYDWFQSKNFFPFPAPVTLVAPTADGIFVGTRQKTYYLTGTDPRKMGVAREVGVGAIPGTLSYGLVAGGGYQVSRKLSQIDTAIWNTPLGIAMGVQGGHILYLTDDNVMIYPRSEGATLVRREGGMQQIINTTFGPAVGTPVPAGMAYMIKSGRMEERQEDLTIGATGGFSVSSRATIL
jgi:hypothetical protein